MEDNHSQSTIQNTLHLRGYIDRFEVIIKDKDKTMIVDFCLPLIGFKPVLSPAAR